MDKNNIVNFGRSVESVVDKELQTIFSTFVKNVSDFAEIFFSSLDFGNNETVSSYSKLNQFFNLYHQNQTGLLESELFNDTISEISATTVEDEVSLFSQFIYSAVIQNYANFMFTLVIIWVTNKLFCKVPLLNSLIEVVLSWCLVLIISPVAILVFGASITARFILSAHLKKYYPGIKLVHALDATWAFERYASASTCIGLYVLQGEYNVNKIVERFSYVLDLKVTKNGKEEDMYERMKCRIVKKAGFVCWEKLKNYQTKNHIKFLKEKYSKADENKTERVKDEDITWTEEKVFTELAGLQDEPFTDQNFSPWEVLIVPNLKISPETGPTDLPYYAIAFRLNHTIMDGVSCGNALRNGLADEPFNFYIDPIAPLKISKIQYYFACFLAMLTLPKKAIGGLCTFEKHRFHGKTLTGVKSMSWSRPLDMTTVKKLKNSTETSIFAVLLSSIGGSFRKLFIKYGEPIPKSINAAPPVAILPFPDRRPRNRFSVILFPIAIGKKTIEERLNAVFEASKEIAQSTDVLTNYYVIHLLGLLPISILSIIAPLAHATLSLSNIPGPAETIHIFGDKLIDIGAWIPVKNTIGIGMALFSYAGRTRVTILADKACLPGKDDVQYVINEFERELGDMAEQNGIPRNDIFVPSFAVNNAEE